VPVFSQVKEFEPLSRVVTYEATQVCLETTIHHFCLALHFRVVSGAVFECRSLQTLSRRSLKTEGPGRR